MKDHAFALQVIFDLLMIARIRAEHHASEYTKGALDALTIAFGILAATAAEDIPEDEHTPELYQVYRERRAACAAASEKTKRK